MKEKWLKREYKATCVYMHTLYMYYNVMYMYMYALHMYMAKLTVKIR